MKSDQQTELAKYIREAMGTESIRSVAERAGISHSSLAKLLAGNAKSQPETLRALAGSLGLSESLLLRLAGHLEESPYRLSNPQAIDIARRLEQLPSGVREGAIEAVAGVLDTIYKISEIPDESRKKNLGERTATWDTMTFEEASVLGKEALLEWARHHRAEFMEIAEELGMEPTSPDNEIGPESGQASQRRVS
jgi:transcriptional regulator with XRE-family HTH domain